MKVMIVVPSLRKTGPIEVVKSLILENNKYKKVDYSLVALRGGYVNQEEFFKKIVDLHVINSRQIFSVNQIKSFRSLIKRINPDIIHFNSFNSEIYLPWIHNRNIKYMTTIHMEGKKDFVFSYGKLVGIIMSMLQKYIYKRMDYFVAVSDSVRDHFKKFGFSPIETIQNGVNIPKDYDINKKKKDVSPVGIYVGNLDKRKNVSLLLDTFVSFPDYKLIILGDNPQNANTLSYYRRKYKNTNIHFIGRVNNVYKYLKRADFFISASLSEGLPMAAIEAMGMDLDLVLSGIPEHKELKKSPSQNIYFFNNNKKDLTKTITKYFNNFRTNSEVNNKKYFQKYFTSYQMFKSYYKTYSRLIGKKKADYG